MKNEAWQYFNFLLKNKLEKYSFFNNFYLNHFMNIAFGPCKLGGIFDLYQNCEVEIMPHIMLSSDVFFKRDVFVVEGFPFQT